MIEKVNIDLIKPNPNNPRVIADSKFKKLVKSIREFPEMLDIRPIVVDNEMIVLGGNMRLKACKIAGLKEVSIIKADNLTEEQKKEFIIKDNNNFGDWDFDMLQSEWDVSLLEEWGLEDVKFDLSNDDNKDEEDDRDVKIDSLYQITIDFPNEEQLKENYDRLLLLGYDCKIIQI